MSTDRLQKTLSSQKSVNAVNGDSYLKVNIDSSQKLLPPDEILKTINVGDQFNTERQTTPYYRIYGTINSTVSNALFNLNDPQNLDLYTWKGFNFYDYIKHEYRFYDSAYPTVVSKYLKERDGWFGYYDPDVSKSGFCNFFDMEPKRERFSFLPDIKPYHNPSAAPVKNWELTITYPHSIDSGHTMVKNGLMIVEAVSAVVSNRNMTAFGVACRHNLNIGDIVRITGTNGYNGDFAVIRTGLDNGDHKEHYFVIDRPSTGSVSLNSRFKRIVGGYESSYYFRKFKKIKTRNSLLIEQDDYETYQAGFSESYYNDNLIQFAFNEDVDISNLVDNLGRPLSELYLTVIKTDSNGLFTNVSSGIETPLIPNLNNSKYNIYLTAIPAINKIHNGVNSPFPTHIPLENNVTILNNNNVINNNDYYGDLVEYNIAEVKETVLAEVHHRFNTINRETSAPFSYTASTSTTIIETLGPRQEGYYYKAHHLIRIRNYSSYVEKGDSSSIFPDYAVALGDGRYLWRDLLDIGFSETGLNDLNYPFLNGCHYMYDNYCFTVKRQDPLDDWGLYYSSYPPDPIGEGLTINVKVNTEENVC